MSFSQSVDRIRPSPTVALTQLVSQLKAAGEDIIGLGAGEPDFETPPHIKAAGMAAIENGLTRYTAPDGILDLKQAICEKFAAQNQLDYTPEEISVGTGGKQVLFNALVSLLNPGDEVVIPCPYWVSYPDIVEFCGATPVFVKPTIGEGMKVSAAQIEAAISPSTKCLILNSPSNPSGIVYSKSELVAIADVLKRHKHVWIISDDIYEHITYAPARFATIAAVAPELKSRCLTLNGVSKAYAMTGWRIGYAGGPKPLIDAMRKLQSQSTTNPSSISQYAALEALRGPQDFLGDWLSVFKRRRDFVTDALNGIEGITCALPEGAFYVFPEISGLIGGTSAAGTKIGTDEDFATALLREAGTATVFGGAFGMNDHFRISYATSDDQLEAAMGRIAKFVNGIG